MQGRELELRQHLAAEHRGIVVISLTRLEGRELSGLEAEHRAAHAAMHVHPETDPGLRGDDREGDALTNAEILAKFEEHKAAGVITYVLPTDPLGAEWIIGTRGGGMDKLVGKAQAVAFLAGVNVTLAWVMQALRNPDSMRHLARGSL